MLITSHSFFSLRYGTISLEKLVEESARLGIKSLALTDINNSSACLDFVSYCFDSGIHPIIGIDFRHKNHYLYTGLACNMEGFYELNEFLSEYNLAEKPMPSIAPEFSNVFMLYAPGSKTVKQLHENEYIGVKPWEINKIVTNGYSQNPSKFIAQYPVTFLSLSDFELHRHLRAVDNNTLLSMLNPDQLARKEELLLPIDRIVSQYSFFPDLVKNSEQLCNNCSVSFDFTTNKNKKCFSASRYDDQLLLEKLAHDGMICRYGKNNAIAKRRINDELGIINKLGFSAYFLITWDIIRYSMSRGIYHNGYRSN